MAAINEIFEAVIQPQNGDFSRQLAQHIIGLKFTEAQAAHMRISHPDIRTRR